MTRDNFSAVVSKAALKILFLSANLYNNILLMKQVYAYRCRIYTIRNLHLRE